MAHEKSRYEKSSLPSINLDNVQTILAAMTDMARNPDELDELTTRLGIPPVLANPRLASTFDMSGIGMGKCVHIPIQITSSTGGRKSLYFLQPGERVLSGLMVTSDGLAYRYTTRETGRTLPAEAGDRYSEEYWSCTECLVRLSGKLQSVDVARGQGELVFDDGSPEPVARLIERAGVQRAPKCKWWFWSFYAECDIIIVATA